MNTDGCNVEDITFTSLNNLCYCLVLHLLRIGPTSFALDHSPLCKNDLDFNDKSDSMTVLESIHIIVINNKSVRVPCEPTGWLFINNSPRSDLHHFIRFPTLEKTIFRQHSTLNSLMSKRPSQVSPFLGAAQSTSSEAFDFHIWFSPGFLMQ